MCSVSAGDSAEAPIWLARLSQSVNENHNVFEAVLDAVRRIEFSDLPKTISGKIRRVQLRNVEAERRQKNEKQEWEFFEEDFPELKA